MSLPPLNWAETEAEPVVAVATIPWEDPDLPLVSAWWRTAFQIIRRPQQFFRQLPLQGGLADPLGFALLLGSLGLWASLCWQLLWPEATSGLILSRILENLTEQQANPLVLVGFFFLIPLVVVGEQFFLSLLLAAAGKLVKRDFTFEGAFRLLAYSNAAFIFNLIPWVGFWLGSLYHFVLLIKGFYYSQSFSLWQILGVLLLTLVMQTVIFLLVLLLAGVWIFWSFWSLLLS